MGNLILYILQEAYHNLYEKKYWRTGKDGIISKELTLVCKNGGNPPKEQISVEPQASKWKHRLGNTPTSNGLWSVGTTLWNFFSTDTNNRFR